MTPMPGVILLPKTIKDLQSNFFYIGRSNATRANSFARNLQTALVRLAQSPFLGSPRPQDNSRLRSMRRYPVPQFGQYGIFYRPFASGNGIEVFRVFHSSRDVSSMLSEALEEE